MFLSECAWRKFKTLAANRESFCFCESQRAFFASVHVRASRLRGRLFFFFFSVTYLRSCRIYRSEARCRDGLLNLLQLRCWIAVRRSRVFRELHRARTSRCTFSLLVEIMHAHTAETLEIHGCGCQGPAAADEILSGCADLCGITKRLTGAVLARAEETMRLMGKIYWCARRAEML